MTSTSAPSRQAIASASGVLDSGAGSIPAGAPNGSPVRRPARFPGASPTPPASADGVAPRALWVGADPALRELVHDHATAVGIELLDTAGDAAVRCLVTDDVALAGNAAAATPGRLPLLVVTSQTEVPRALWERALAAGARAVLALPDGSEELLSQLTELARPRAASTVIAVAGGCGGAGTSSFAARLAAAARPSGPVVLIDADPLGGGLDLLVEGTEAEGISWEDATGLGPDDGAALREGLPRIDEIALLGSRAQLGPEPPALSRVLSALTPLGGTVVVDLADALVPVAAEHADHLLLVVPASDHAVRAAARRLRTWRLPDAITQVVVRRRGPLTPAEVADDLALPLAASFRDGPRGAVPLLDVRRRGADRAARRLLQRLLAESRS